MGVKLSRRGRWAVPVIAVAVTGGVIAGTQIPSAQASPVLPARTPGQLLAEINQDAEAAAADRHRGGDDLARPAAAAAGRQPDVAVVAAHRLAHDQGLLPERAALPAVGAAADERDRRHQDREPRCGSGRAPATRSPSSPRPRQSRKARAKQKLPASAVLTPQQAANEMLKAVGKTTLVSVQANVIVADEPAYQLVLKPQGRPLADRQGDDRGRRQVRRAAAGPGIRQGRLRPGVPVRLHRASMFTAPAAANFDFTPPPARRVKVNASDRQRDAGRAARSGDHERLRHLRHRAGSRWWRSRSKISFRHSDTGGGPASNAAHCPVGGGQAGSAATARRSSARCSARPSRCTAPGGAARC